MRDLFVIADKTGRKQLAFFHALEIAKNTGAKIDFIGFIHAPGVDSSEILTRDEKKALRARYLEQKQQEMEEFLASVDLTGVTVKQDVVWTKSPDAWVIQRCEERAYDMIFKTGTRNKSFQYTAADWELMQNCSEPVMMVGDNPWREGGVILAALDLSSDSVENMQLNERILRDSFKIAKATESQVHACYSIAVPQALRDLDIINPETYEKRVREQLDPVLRKLLSEGGLKSENFHMISGKPNKVIVRLAEQIKADLVVIGKKNRASIMDRLMGTTAENVLNKVKSDVIVIK